jgi:hypothetical protein
MIDDELELELELEARASQLPRPWLGNDRGSYEVMSCFSGARSHMF